MKKIIGAFLLIIFVSFLSGCINKKIQQENNTNNIKTEVKTYRNEEFGFEVNYPKDWSIDKDRTVKGEVFFNDNLPSRISIKYKNNFNNESLEDVKNSLELSKEAISKEYNTIIDGENALVVETNEEGVNYRIFKHNGNIYEIINHNANDLIISSFKFIQGTENNSQEKSNKHFSYIETIPDLKISQEDVLLKDYFFEKRLPFNISWVENMVECRSSVDTNDGKYIIDKNKEIEWINFYNNLFNKFNEKDVVTTYTFSHQEDGGTDTFYVDIMPNKLGYKTTKDFEKDFSFTCGIGDDLFVVSDKYLLTTSACGGMNNEHKIQCFDLRDMFVNSFKLK